jgi:pimeloyl-ACP methyl ester carboxylesterase
MEKLYFLPGTMCTDELWLFLEERLKNRFELVYLSVPNGLELKELVSYYDAIFDKEIVNLVGFSMGGYITAYLQCKLKHKIKRALIISNTPSKLPECEVQQRFNALKLITEHGYNGIPVTKARVLLGVKNSTKLMIDLLKDMDALLGEESLVSQYTHLTVREDLYEQLCINLIPTLFYCSPNDPLIDSSWLTKLCAANERIALSWSVGEGHMLPLETPNELAMIILDWFGSCFYKS